MIVWLTVTFLSARISLSILLWLLINKALPLTEFTLTWCFLFVYKFESLLSMKIPANQQFRKYSHWPVFNFICKLQTTFNTSSVFWRLLSVWSFVHSHLGDVGFLWVLWFPPSVQKHSDRVVTLNYPWVWLSVWMCVCVCAWCLAIDCLLEWILRQCLFLKNVLGFMHYFEESLVLFFFKYINASLKKKKTILLYLKLRICVSNNSFNQTTVL